IQSHSVPLPELGTVMRTAVVTAALLACSGVAQGQAPVPVLSTDTVTDAATTRAVYHGREGRIEITPPRIEAELTIDGRLDENAWASASLLTGFSQFTPLDGIAADDSTEVLVFYTEHALHFGIRAFEPHGSVNATLAERDRITGDDYIQIILDTFNDRRRGLVFLVNPLGVQGDGTFADASGTDLNPDFLFESRGRLTDDGYEVEIRIPFKSIRYQPDEVQSWGVNIVRRVQHSGQEQAWTQIQRGHPSFLGQSGRFTGLTRMNRGLVLDVNPVMTARMTGAPRSDLDPSWRYTRHDPE